MNHLALLIFYYKYFSIPSVYLVQTLILSHWITATVSQMISLPEFCQTQISNIGCQIFQNHTSDLDILLLKTLHSFPITHRIKYRSITVGLKELHNLHTYLIPTALNQLSFPTHLCCVSSLCALLYAVLSATNNLFTSLPFPVNSHVFFKNLKKASFYFPFSSR